MLINLVERLASQVCMILFFKCFFFLHYLAPTTRNTNFTSLLLIFPFILIWPTMLILSLVNQNYFSYRRAFYFSFKFFLFLDRTSHCTPASNLLFIFGFFRITSSIQCSWALWLISVTCSSFSTIMLYNTNF